MQGMDRQAAFIGIDLGGTNLRFALVRREGTIIQRLREPTLIERGWDDLAARLIAGINLLRVGAKEKRLVVEGIGMGIPGLIRSDGQVNSSVNLPPLEGKNVRERLEAVTGVPVVTANDANAAAYGEKTFGAGRGFASLLVVTLGTGVGSGLILHDRLWTGRDGYAAEFGHVTVEPDGLPCGCGNRGCLEQYASASALATYVRQVLIRDHPGVTSSLLSQELTAADVGRAALAGDGIAREAFRRAGRYLGIAVSSVVNLLNPEAVIVCGGMASSFNLLEGSLRLELDSRAYPQMAAGMTVTSGQLGDDAGLLGAATLAAEQLCHP